MYLDYAHQLLWHSLEANNKMKEVTGGKFEFCGPLQHLQPEILRG